MTMEQTVSAIEATMLLCDYAEAVGGKLYIMGGGWSISPPGLRNMALAIRILVPWDEANIEHRIRAVLMDDSGRPVEFGNPPVPVVQEGTVVVGHPPTLRKGTPLDVVLAMQFNGLPLPPSSHFRWQLEIGEEPACGASFQTSAPGRTGPGAERQVG